MLLCVILAILLVVGCSFSKSLCILRGRHSFEIELKLEDAYARVAGLVGGISQFFAGNILGQILGKGSCGQ